MKQTKWTTTACENHQSTKYWIYTTPKGWSQIMDKRSEQTKTF
jgi:hypothetical protein